MEANDLATTLDRASAMLGELGDPKHHAHHHTHHHKEPQAVSSPKHYYELHMMALEELPNLEEYLLQLSKGGVAGAGFVLKAQFTMKELYDIVQYCPRAVPRLYLQICAGSALMRSIMSGDTTEEVDGVSIKEVLIDLQESVKCVQCPIRGLFLRHYMLQAVKDKLPDDEPLRKEMGVDRSDSPSIIESVTAEETLIASKSSDNANNVEMAQHNRELQHLMENLGVDVEKNDMEKEELLEHDEKKNALMGDLGVPKSDSNALFEDIGLEDVPPLPECPPPPVPSTATGGNGVSGASGEGIVHANDTGSGSVKDSYEFVLSNFIEMNKLWVRIQHLPGDSKSKDVKMRRERERNELRMMVGTNLVRISELEGVTSAIYGTVILPKILDQIVACHDPLAQAYLMDCIIQVFPDEYHIQTLEVVLSVCPKLREKVNVKTILQSIMDRLAKYYADELLLNDEKDTEGVKTSVMLDSFHMFDECIMSVLKARGVKLTARETIRLQSALLDFCLKCYPGRMDLIDHCLGTCASALRGETAVGTVNPETGDIISTPVSMTLDDTAVKELEKMLSLPLEELSLRVLGLTHYSGLLSLLPRESSKTVAVSLLETLDSSGERLTDTKEQDQLFAIMSPLVRENANVTSCTLVARVVYLIYNENPDVHFELLFKAKHHLAAGGNITSFIPLFYATLKLLDRVKVFEFPKQETDDSDKITNESEKDEDFQNEEPVETVSQDDSVNNDIKAAESSEYFSSEDDIAPEENVEPTSTRTEITSQSDLFADAPLPDNDEKLHEPKASSRQITCRKIFLFAQKLISSLKTDIPTQCFELCLQAAAAANSLSIFVSERGGNNNEYAPVAYEFITEAFLAYETGIVSESNAQENAITSMIGTLCVISTFDESDYQVLITKVTQYAARLLKKASQCRMVMLCSHLFYSARETGYKNPSRVLECLQRALKIADICVSASPSDLQLFVDILDCYLYHFETKNPAITDRFISGLIALINEHIVTIGINPAISEAKKHFIRTVQYIEAKRSNDQTSQQFEKIVCKIPA